jgi:signal transduction histidine kinase
LTSQAPAPAVPIERLRDEYLRSLQSYVGGGGEAALRRAYDFGRGALGKGVSLLDMVMLHQSALVAVLPQHVGEEARVTTEATQFLTESLSPFEMAYLGFFEANAGLRALNDTLESEARRIARMLHDGAGQLLFALELALGDLGRDVPAAGGKVAELLDLTHQVDQQLRCLSRELHPVILDDLGLVPALEILGKRITTQTRMSVTLKSSIRDRLPQPVELCLYRVVHEALTNIVRHARADEAIIEIDRRGAVLVCSVRDNGVGFSPNRTPRGGPGGLGLVGMRVRLNGFRGSLDVASAPGRGTELLITIPLSAGEGVDGVD